MLFKNRTAVLMMTIAIIGTTTALVMHGTPADASPPDILVVNEDAVSTGQVLDTGALVSDECVMNYEQIEVVVEVSTDEPEAGIILRIDETCRLIVLPLYFNQR